MGNLDFTELIGRLVIYFVVMLLAFTSHEAAHAWMSNKFGDSTAKDLGRMTLNPAPHIDIFGTIILPIVTFLGSGAGFFPILMGYPKPTPINPRNWTNYKLANIMVSAAGVMANMTLVVIGLIVAKVLMQTQGLVVTDFFGSIDNPFALFIGYTMSLNLSLFVLNLIPIPPLDGSEIFKSLLPQSVGNVLDSIAPYGFFILILLVMTGVLRYIMMPFFIVLMALLEI